MTGIIFKALSGFYYVACSGTTYECRARGSNRYNGVSPLVGDKVEFEVTGDCVGVVDKILPRKNALLRPPVANIDRLFIVSAYEKPMPNTFIIDKIAAIAEYNDIEPIIVFNKSDKGSFERLSQLYNKAGFKTFVVSAETGEGIEELKDELKGYVSAFTGNSGVGKSSILNCIFGDTELAVGEISDKLGRGRHTTRHTELLSLPFGGFAADTPGFSSIDCDSTDYVFKENLLYSFRDLSKYDGLCRFDSCTHTGEPNCAIKNAAENGEIAESRLKSYIELFNELKDLRPWNSRKNKNK